jgi:Protein of unknown function (DUF732)
MTKIDDAPTVMKTIEHLRILHDTKWAERQAELGTRLAYSQPAYAHSEPEPQSEVEIQAAQALPRQHLSSWKVMTLAVGVSVLITVMAVVIAMMAMTINTSEHQQVSSPPMTTVAPAVPGPTTEVPPPPLPMVPDAQHMLTGDDWYIAMINGSDNWTVTDRAGAIEDGHRVCGWIGAGHTISQTEDVYVQNVMRAKPTLTLDQARDLVRVAVNAAIKAYCPQYAE